MKANDLRIGNYVKTKFSKQRGKPIQINAIKSNLKGVYYGEEMPGELEVWADIKWLKPIPLTEEWLLKFGFKKHKTDDRYITFAKANININDGIVNLVGYPNFLNHIKHVHQLQNLYHALTGKEL